MALKRISTGLFLIALGSAAVAVAATPTEIITARQQSYKQIGKANKAILDELRKPAPSVAVLKTNARLLEAQAPKVATWFPKGTGPEAGVKTKALPAIWQKNADFKKANAAFIAATKALRAAADSGNPAQVKAALPTLSRSCSGCHDNFRAKS